MKTKYNALLHCLKIGLKINSMMTYGIVPVYHYLQNYFLPMPDLYQRLNI